MDPVLICSEICNRVQKDLSTCEAIHNSFIYSVLVALIDSLVKENVRDQALTFYWATGRLVTSYVPDTRHLRYDLQ